MSGFPFLQKPNAHLSGTRCHGLRRSCVACRTQTERMYDHVLRSRCWQIGVHARYEVEVVVSICSHVVGPTSESPVSGCNVVIQVKVESRVTLMPILLSIGFQARVWQQRRFWDNNCAFSCCSGRRSKRAAQERPLGAHHTQYEHFVIRDQKRLDVFDEERAKLDSELEESQHDRVGASGALNSASTSTGQRSSTGGVRREVDALQQERGSFVAEEGCSWVQDTTAVCGHEFLVLRS